VHHSPNARRIRWRKLGVGITGEGSKHNCDKKNIKKLLLKNPRGSAYRIILKHILNRMRVRVMKTNLIRYLSSVYFVNQSLYVSGIFIAHHQEVYYIYIYIQQLVRVVYTQYTS